MRINIIGHYYVSGPVFEYFTVIFSLVSPLPYEGSANIPLMDEQIEASLFSRRVVELEIGFRFGQKCGRACNF